MQKNLYHLCLDIGNSQIHAGLFKNNKLVADFRFDKDINLLILTEEINRAFDKYDVDKIKSVGVSSVVKDLNDAIIQFSSKYSPNILFVNNQIKTNLSFSHPIDPSCIGSDLIAAAIAATDHFPKLNVIILDMGTATTITAIKNSNFLGCAILPGLTTQLKALNTISKELQIHLEVNISSFIGIDTDQAIRAGVYQGHIGSINYLIENIAKQSFPTQNYKLIITGGLSRYYSNESALSFPNLVLDGIMSTLLLNKL